MFFVKDFIVGGVEQVLVTTLNELSAQGYEILVVWSGYLEKNHLYKKINPSIKQLDTNDIWHLVDENKPKSGLKKLVYFFKKNLNLYFLRNIGKYIPDFESYDYLIDFKNGSSKVCDIKSYPKQKKVVWIHGAFSRLSWNIEMWCSDLHSIYDFDGNVLNVGKEIIIGDNVWIGKDVHIAKNSRILNNSVVGWCSNVVGNFGEENVIIAGNPAKIVKRNIIWKKESVNSLKKDLLVK